MTLKETLAALDAKATKGEWLMRKIGHDHLQVHNALEHEVLSSPRAANALLAAALVNAYRTGQLVVAPSVEDVAAVVAPELGVADPLTLRQLQAKRIARAILTSMGAKTDGN